MSGNDYITRHLNWVDEKSVTHSVTDLQLLRFDKPLIILGPPGMGKTRLMEQLGTQKHTKFVRAISFLRWNETQLDETVRLIIDGLDEVAAAEEGDPLHNVLKKLARCGRPPFVLSCRSAEWNNYTAKLDIVDDYLSTPIVLTLMPLTREEAETILSKCAQENITSQVLDQLDASGLSYMYANPLTLGFIVAIISSHNAMPSTRAGLYDLAVKQLRKEEAIRHAKSDLARLSEVQALDAAGLAMAALLVTGREALVSASGENSTSVLSIPDLAAMGNTNDIEAIIRSNLFKSEGNDHARYVPIHRTVAEYLGARWLSGQIERNSNKASAVARLFGLISSQGGVPASLRGMHAWLAHFSPALAKQVIATDPYALLRYGDVDSLSTEQARQLLAALKSLSTEDPFFRSSDWQRISAKGLAQEALFDEIREIIIDTENSWQLRSLMLEILKESELALKLRKELTDIVFDQKRSFHERSTSSEVLADLPESTTSWRKCVEDLINLSDEDSTRLAVGLICDVGVMHFDDYLIAEAVIRNTGILDFSENDDRSLSSIGDLTILQRNIPDDRIEGILDRLASRILPTRNLDRLRDNRSWEASYEIAAFAFPLIRRQLNISPTPAQKLWGWLCSFVDSHTHQSQDGEQIEKYLEENDPIRREIQCSYLLDCSQDQFFLRLHRLGEYSNGLNLNDGDKQYLLVEIVRRNNREDVDRWKFFLSQLRVERTIPKEIIELARPYAEGDSELLKFLTTLPAKLPMPDWEKKDRRNRRIRERTKINNIEKSRREFLEHIEEMRTGNFGWVLNPARAYLGIFNDLTKTLPHERLSEWLGDELCSAALVGFEAVLHRQDLPTEQQVSDGYAQSKRWNFVYPMIAGAVSRMYSNREFADLAPSLLSSIIIAAEHELIEQRKGISGLVSLLTKQLRLDAGAYEAHIRRKFEPHLRENHRHIIGLYSFTRSIEELPLSARLAVEWLERFPELTFEVENELVNCLINSLQNESLDYSQQLTIIAKARVRDCNDNARHKFWASVQFLLDFDVATKLIPDTAGERADWIWPFTSWFFDKFQQNKNLPEPMVKHLEWVVSSFRVSWPVIERPSGVTSGDENPWNATDRINWAIQRLATNPSEESTNALYKLRDMGVDGYTIPIQAAIASQRRLRLEVYFKSPSLLEFKAALTNAPPCSAADVQAIVLNEFASLQERLRGDALNIVNNFYDDDRKPRSENACRDQILIALGNLPFGIQATVETAMPQGKRSDGVFAYGTFAVPLEVKGQWHDEVWTAASTQLDGLYSVEHKATSKGIYVVCWFGPNAPRGKKLKLPPSGISMPKTPGEMRIKLESLLPSFRRGDIAIVVLDVTRPCSI